MARKLGSICNPNDVDFKMQQELPTLKNKASSSLLDLAMFNPNRIRIDVKDPEPLFSEITEEVSHLLGDNEDQNLSLNDILSSINCATLRIIEQNIDCEKERLLVTSKFKEAQLSFQVCTFIKENMLSIEGIQIENPDTLILFATIWQTLSSQVRVSTDTCDEQFLLTMKLFASLYENLKLNEYLITRKESRKDNRINKELNTITHYQHRLFPKRIYH